MPKRQRSKPPLGMAGLPSASIEAFKAGRLTLDDLASQAGVSKQAASKWLRRRKLGRQSTSDTAETGEGAASSPALAGDTTQHHPMLVGLSQEEGTLKRLAAGSAIAAIARANSLLAGNAPLGASAVKACVTAMADAVETLARLGVLNLDQPDNGGLPELTVRVMTPQEVAKVRAEAEGEA